MLAKLSDINRTQKCCISEEKILSVLALQKQSSVPISQSFRKCLLIFPSKGKIHFHGVRLRLKQQLGVRSALSRERSWSQTLAYSIAHSIAYFIAYSIGFYPILDT